MSNSFAHSLIGTGRGWLPKPYFDLSITTWMTAWNSASPDDKQSIAHAYLWAYAKFKHSSYDHREGHSEIMSRLWTEDYRFFRTIHPHVEPAFLNRDNLGDSQDFLVSLFKPIQPGVTDRYKYLPHLCALWFGTDSEQCIALNELASDPQIKDALFMTGTLLAILGWDLATRTGNAQAMGQAAALSWQMGLKGLYAPPGSTAEQAAWFHLGRQDTAYEANILKPDHKSEQDMLLQFEQENMSTGNTLLNQLRMLPESALAEAAKHIIPSITMHVKEHGHLLLSGNVFSRSLPDDATAYDVLKLLLPARKTVIELAESLGQPYSDLCTCIAAETETVHVTSAVPDNIST